MTLDDDAAYRVLEARDARFDGRLFVGVTSTGIYCRPVCRVRLPRRENCLFFRTPAQAEASSFRPCLKCRPELAPGPGLPWSVMDASRTLATQAARRLDAAIGDGETPSVAALAARLGVSDRHLRRIFLAEHGVSPMQYLHTRRLLLAKQLLTDTALPVSSIAHASGFLSLRRFNDAFVTSYRMNPTQLRRDANHTAEPLDVAGVLLALRLPYDDGALLRFLGARAIPGIEVVDGQRIRRSIRPGVWGAEGGWLEAEFLPPKPNSVAHVRLRYAPAFAQHSAHVVADVRRWLDLDADPSAIDAVLHDLPGDAGLRLPGSVDAFEMAVRAVLGQQVTVAAARTLARRLVEKFGEPMESPWPDIDRLFPSPAVLGAVEADRISELGIIRSRAGAIRALAVAWPALSTLMREQADPAPLIAALCELPGIGPWTAHYIAMRATGWPDAFPPRDIAVLNAMKALFGTSTSAEAERQSVRWQPWRAYAVLRLWNSLTPP